MVWQGSDRTVSYVRLNGQGQGLSGGVRTVEAPWPTISVAGRGATDGEGREPGASALGATIPVSYAGTVPDIFREGIQVVVEGRIDEAGTFQAETLLAKCPSKYQEAGQLSSDPAPASRS